MTTLDKAASQAQYDLELQELLTKQLALEQERVMLQQIINATGGDLLTGYQRIDREVAGISLRISQSPSLTEAIARMINPGAK